MKEGRRGAQGVLALGLAEEAQGERERGGRVREAVYGELSFFLIGCLPPFSFRFDMYSGFQVR